MLTELIGRLHKRLRGDCFAHVVDEYEGANLNQLDARLGRMVRCRGTQEDVLPEFCRTGRLIHGTDPTLMSAKICRELQAVESAWFDLRVGASP